MAELTDGGVVELTFLHSCVPEDVAALRSRASPRRYEAGTAIFHEREAPGRVYVVDSGFVKMSRLSDEDAR